MYLGNPSPGMIIVSLKEKIQIPVSCMFVCLKPGNAISLTMVHLVVKQERASELVLPV